MKNNSQKQALWIVTELFYPEETSTSYILTKIANNLADKYDVNVICGPLVYESSKQVRSKSFILDDRIKVIRHDIKSLNKNNLFTRGIKFLKLSSVLSISLFKHCKKGDKVLIVTNPAPLLLIVALLRKFKKFELSVIVHDIFPENTIPARVFKSKTNLLYRFIKLLFDYSYSQADKLVVLGRDMKQVIELKISRFTHKPDIAVIENWAEVEMITPIDNSLLSGKINFQYAGNLGRVQGLIPLTKLFSECGNDIIHLSFWGDGAVRKDIEQMIRMNSVTNISLHGTYSREQQNEVLNSCDMAIVSLSPSMYGLGVPSKVYNIMAAGKPVLYIGDDKSEVALMIREYDLGICFSPDEYDALESYLKSMSISNIPELKKQGSKAREVAEKYYSQSVIMDKYHKFI